MWLLADLIIKVTLGIGGVVELLITMCIRVNRSTFLQNIIYMYETWNGS